jgi:topoisomerase-4 subunit B
MDTGNNTYLDDNIITLEWNEHIRRRPGMYIGNSGDGSLPDDGIYILLKEVLDNSIDEFAMGFGKRIDIRINGGEVNVRDYGRGIPLGKVVDVSSKMNTGAKYDNQAFKKSVGLNGVGIKAVNALSSAFEIVSVRDGQSSWAHFTGGELIRHAKNPTDEKTGTIVRFIPDEAVFGPYAFNMEFVEQTVRHYTYLNAGLQIDLNGTVYMSKNGLLDWLNEDMNEEPLYPPVHLQGTDIEIVITHGHAYGESIASFVNGQHTTQGGTHLSAFREAVSKTIKDFYKKDFDPADVRHSMVAAVSVKIEEPIFNSQTKIKLGSKDMSPGGVSVRNFIGDFLKEKLDNYLHKHPETADILLKKILESEKERKAISGIQKLARERAKKSNLHNKKLRDCRIHYNDKHEVAEESTLFITEGDSASGSITKSRDVNTQAVFSLRGKPLNTFGMTKKIVYENEEFNLLQAALNIEDDIENLRYNKVVIATDADVDGMHIRLLLITFFLQFFPDIIRQGHLYILQTPLFRVRNKKATFYCYTPEEREQALRKLGKHPEITRFKGLGEISPSEFAGFIGETMRLDRVRLSKDDNIHDLLEFYMGKNTPDRQEFIVNNLRIEEGLEEVEEEVLELIN